MRHVKSCVRCGGDGFHTEVRWPRARRWFPICEACWMEWFMLTKVYRRLGLEYR